MKLITKDTDYATRALCFIAKQRGEVVSVKELVACLKVPQPFLRKILQVLNKRRLLKSYKGKGGGFVPACDLRRISVSDIMEIFQGPFDIIEHTFKGRMCPEAKRCCFKKRLDRIGSKVKSELGSISINSLMKGSS